MSSAISLLAVVVGCNFSNPSDSLGFHLPAASAVNTFAPVVQANCPTVTVLDANAVHRVYTSGAKDDPQKLAYQVALYDTTRSCRMTESALIVNVLAHGRLVPGPTARPGRVTIPIRLMVKDGNGENFEETTNFTIDIPAGSAGKQFIFNNDHVAIPNTSGGAPKTVSVFLGFVEQGGNGKK